MSVAAKESRRRRLRRHRAIRYKISGTDQRPRLNVFRSGANMYLQLIDDETGRTLASAWTKESEVAGGTKTDEARKAGKLLGERALTHGIRQVVFDRGGYLYHGRVKAAAEGAREAGLEF
ncbi:MAG TPA: 50S ribosomal protein L18 [Chloroflexota bacterium]|nr:50S ribosomal protein L18 [Chloroflexota bacterium]